MLPGSQSPPCTPLPFCGISCTCATSTPSSVAAVVLPVLIAVDNRNGAQIQGILSPIWLTHPFGIKQRYRYVYDAHPVLWLRKSWQMPSWWPQVGGLWGVFFFQSFQSRTCEKEDFRRGKISFDHLTERNCFKAFFRAFFRVVVFILLYTWVFVQVTLLKLSIISGVFESSILYVCVCDDDDDCFSYFQQ